jgi:ribosomal protein S18 acetylase RimI-like enzyme
LQAAEEHARLRGCARLELKTARSNVTAQSLYESLGWVRDKLFYGYSKQTDG